VVSGRGSVLVTGATGFIGGHLAERLVGEGYRVHCLVRATSDISLLGALPGIELVTGDLTDARSVAAAVEGCRLVVHAGALVSDWATVDEIEAINVGGTWSLLQASTAASVRRFVFISTTDVHGTRFRNWYAQTKLLAEAQVRRAELDTVVLRPATVYGPRSIEVVGEIADAIRSRRMLLIDRGRAIAGLCYVDNLIDAVTIALRHPAAPSQSFDISDGVDVTWKQFTDDLARGLGCPPVRLSVPYWLANGVATGLEHGYRLLRKTTGLRTRPLLSRQAVHVLGHDQDFSNERARELLGWEPRVGYPAGLAATLAWLQTV
jgi:nucleoside-diphosphate-sugar epimerase